MSTDDDWDSAMYQIWELSKQIRQLEKKYYASKAKGNYLYVNHESSMVFFMLDLLLSKRAKYPEVIVRNRKMMAQLKHEGHIKDIPHWFDTDMPETVELWKERVEAAKHALSEQLRYFDEENKRLDEPTITKYEAKGRSNIMDDEDYLWNVLLWCDAPRKIVA